MHAELIKVEEPVYVLCGYDELPPGMPDGDRFSASGLGRPRGFYGLLWGAGDWERANLGLSPLWAVVKVTSYSLLSGARGAVEFDECEIVACGPRPLALKALIDLGAEPADFPFQFSEGEICSVGNCGVAAAAKDISPMQSHFSGIAESGDFGWSKSGLSGISKTGKGGFAQSLEGGLAIAGEGGIAEVADWGVAVSTQHHGMATAGSLGVAIGLGDDKLVTSGDDGIAVATGKSKAIAGRKGIAICLSTMASVGAGGIAVGEIVEGGAGSLLVATKWSEETKLWDYAVGVVGRNGLEPYIDYHCVDGALKPICSSEGYPNPYDFGSRAGLTSRE
jgi:hypothetical protein